VQQTNKLCVDADLIKKTVTVLTLLGKYSNNGIDIRIDALTIADELTNIVNNSK